MKANPISKVIDKFLAIVVRWDPLFFIDWRVKRYIQKNGFQTKIWGDILLEPHIEENFNFFLSQEEHADKTLLNKLRHDIIKCYILYGTNANEYFSYKFREKDHHLRDTYMPRKRKDELCIQIAGKDFQKFFSIIKDKNKFYNFAKNFFHRDAVSIREEQDFAAFDVFCQKHPKFIIKPAKGGCGNGIEILEISNQKSARQIFDYMLQHGPYLVEELIQQDERISAFNDTSLNTIRVPSIMTAKGPIIFHPSIRLGRKGSIIDNAGAGGTFATIDEQTGIILTDGFDKRGHHYDKHPDSHLVYKGFQIPEWSSLKEIVCQAHSIMPKELKYIGWDLALSNKGWCIIEANWGELSMPQITLGKGLYYEFRKLILHK